MAGGAAGGFITRAFESMFKECGRKYPDLKKSIQAYQDISELRNQERTSQTECETGTITSVLASVGQTLEGPYVQLVLDPLRLSLETKNWKLIEPALDCLHKLIAYDHLEGDPGEDGGKNGLLFTEILNMVCDCADNSSPTSTSLQVLKLLLTAVSSTKFRVHGDPLLNIVRVCYNIAVNSVSPISQNTAKAMLTQTVSVTFRRMEAGPIVASPSGEHASGRNTETTVTEKLSTNSWDTSTGDPDDKGNPSRDAARQVKHTTLTSAELQTLSGVADVKGFEAVLDRAVRQENAKKITRMDQVERDAFLVFRILCKRGMKEENDEVTTKTRILSLELLQGLLEGFSDSFTKNLDFIDSVKSYLSYSVLRASVSKSPVIFQYATDIFVLILLRFRQSLKGEIAISFPLVVLRTLDGLESPIDRKRSVLRMLGKVCKDPQMLVDIFVNYDCDPDAPNIFERMVTSLSKIAQGTENIDPNSVAMSPAVSIKGTSLQCLVNVLNSLGEWEKECRKSKKQGDIAHSHQEEVAEAAESVETNIREGATSKFEKENDNKTTLEDAISKFNRQPKEGVEYMISNKLVEKEATSVAQFLKVHNLDKTIIGDYLGEHEDFPVSVMHAYFDSMNFSGMKFDTAIREFLKEFRLPGEAQKIDRIMEKFAERYYACNPGLFQSADAAYVLAYAIIMLNADAHDPTVWPKMSKSEFTRLTVMDDLEESAPTELLEDIYDSIVKEEINMNDDLPDTEKTSGQNAETEAQRHVRILNLALPRRKSPDGAKSESEGIIKKTQASFTKEDVKRGVFYTSQQIEVVRPMVETVGWPLLATFSVTMEEVDNMPWILLSMDGFKAGVHITYVVGMDTLRYAFLTSLIRFTFLHAPRDMRVKNLEALRTLLVLCELEPESLQETWNAVLECISRLEFITTTPSMSAVVMFGANQLHRDAVVQSLRDLAGKPAELVFTGSVGLPSACAMEFFTALSGVSAEELKQSPPRVFSLQKLVEISYLNMSRIRMVWTRIWSVLAKHFVSVGSHREQKVAMYAIDSLRQIGVKCLERAELANFTFQNDILRPFVLLMKNCPYESTRRLILDCIVKMINSKVGSIRSGWRGVFSIFSAAADDESESIVEKAFENVEQILLEHFGKIFGDCFTDCVNCLIQFAGNKKLQRISLKAIALLRICEDRLAEGIIPGGTKKPVDANADSNFDVAEHYWFPMLAGLSELTSDPRHEIRNCAREVLFDLVHVRGNKFSASCWENIFHRVLFPIVDQARKSGNEGALSSDDEWLRETSIQSLQLLCDLFNTFYKEVSFMLPPLLSLLIDCTKKMDQSVVSISLGALMHIIEIGADQFSESDWDTLLTSIRDASLTTQPVELLNDSSFATLGSEAQPLVQSDGATVNSGDNESADQQKHNAGDNGKSPLVLPRNDEHKESGMQMNADRSEGLISKNLMYFIIYGLPPPDSKGNGGDQKSGLQTNTGAPSKSGRVPKPAERRLERNQTIGQKIMGNMMDNLFFRNLTSQTKNQVQNDSVLSNPVEERAVEPDRKDKEENPNLRITRGKCITQLLLLCALDDIQKKYWSKLGDEQKIAIMEILFSLLEFSASYNSYTKLGSRMHQTHDEKPPLNLLRQELAATTIYLDTLHKSTSGFDTKKEDHPQSDDLHSADTIVDSDSSITKHHNVEKLERIAEEKLVSFCQQALKEASDFHSNFGERNNMHMHRVLGLRTPVTVKILKGMRDMNNDIFRRHLKEFYPLLIKLVCCDQIDVRGALDDLFQTQLKPLLPRVA